MSLLQKEFVKETYSRYRSLLQKSHSLLQSHLLQIQKNPDKFKRTLQGTVAPTVL